MGEILGLGRLRVEVEGAGHCRWGGQGCDETETIEMLKMLHLVSGLDSIARR
jgi:hypothetical protein